MNEKPRTARAKVEEKPASPPKPKPAEVQKPFPPTWQRFSPAGGEEVTD
jgi:hypothetical protein